ncbi:hypothetical protein HPB48_012512 [Haemaphysalis longicornis]|uniref:UBX domain-containing protein n=1 Tax=Haemaphysalis longicornis TaxID=44386 RepID=A0A9J6GZM5_HAELO|nr:hypothetical protein HPB48_012512 [Haemaphysalis longicornis]
MIEDLERCREILTRHNWDLELFFLFFSKSCSLDINSLVRENVGSDPLVDVMSFIEEFENRYGSSHPVFYQGTYSQALNDAKHELRFLLIYLHGDDHQDTAAFCRDVLSYRPLIEFINGNMLFWACSVNYSEGYRGKWHCSLSQALRENTYPFLAVIVLREHRMTVVGRLEGLMQPDTLIQRLQQIMADNEAALISARLERDERSLTQSLRQQQDEAYQASLLADQEKERRRLEELRQQEEEAQRQQEQALQEQRRKEEIRRMKLELVDQIPEEPPDSDPHSIHLVIKLPAGTRLERRFRRTQSLKQYLYFYVFCQSDAPESFEIITNFPRRTLPCEPTRECPEPPSFAELGLGKTETLFVHDLEA